MHALQYSFSTALGSQGVELLLSCNQARNPDALSRTGRPQTIWNAQYPLWLRHHAREHRQVDLETVVTRRTVVIGRSFKLLRCMYGGCDKNR